MILSPLSSTSRLLKIGVSSKTLSQMDLTLLAKWTIRPRLMSIPGVANVAIWGQRDRQYQVLVDPDRLRLNGVTLDTVVKAVTDASIVAGGGFVDMPNQRIAVRHSAAIEAPEDLAKMTVAFRNGAPLRLGDVAEIKVGFPPPIGDAVINDGEGLLLIVEKQPTGNTLQVTQEVEKALEALKPGLKGVDIDPTIFRPAGFIERSLENLKEAMLIGCVLVIIILVTFLFDWRTAVISLTAIPLSLIAATLVLTAMGATLNTMVIAGLVIAMGEVVDDAIIDVENIVRRLRLNRAVAPAAVGLPGRPGRLARSPQRRRLRQPDRDPGVRAGLLPRRAVGLVLPAAGPGLRAGDPGLAAGRPDRDAGPVAHAPDRRHRAPAGVAAGAGPQGDVPRDPAAAGAAARAGRWSSSPRPSSPRAGASTAWARSSCPTSRRTTS